MCDDRSAVEALISRPQEAADRACMEALGSSGFCAVSVAQILERYAERASLLEGAVPGINSSGVATANTLRFVKVRGMVQDQSDQAAVRMLSAKCSVGGGLRCNLFDQRHYEQALPGQELSDYLNLMELYIVPVPGESPWVTGEGSNFRCGGAVQRRGCVRSRDGDVIDERKPSEPEAGSHESFIDATLNCPTSGAQGQAPRHGFVVEAYCDFDSAPPLNSIVEVYGVLHPLEMEEEEAGMDEDGAEENDARRVKCRKESNATTPSAAEDELVGVGMGNAAGFSRLPDSLVRRVTALHCRVASAAPQMPMPGQQLLDARASLLNWLTRACLGDAVVAELVMLQMMSGVAQRQPMVTGTLPLLISSVTPAFVAALGRAAQAVCERSVVWGLKRETLNEDTWVPCRKADEDLISAGRLQLPSGTLTILDETGLTAGPLSKTGIENLAAISRMCQQQDVLYRFPYAEVSFKTDLPVIIATPSGGRSILASQGCVGLQCPLQPTAEGVMEWEVPIAWREYMLHCRQVSPSVDGCLRESFLDDLAQAQRDFPSSFGRSSVITDHSSHQLITVAVNVARSLGTSSVCAAEWKHALNLGREVLRRRAAAPPVAP